MYINNKQSHPTIINPFCWVALPKLQIPTSCCLCKGHGQSVIFRPLIQPLTVEWLSWRLQRWVTGAFPLVVNADSLYRCWSLFKGRSMVWFWPLHLDSPLYPRWTLTVVVFAKAYCECTPNGDLKTTTVKLMIKWFLPF